MPIRILILISLFFVSCNSKDNSTISGNNAKPQIKINYQEMLNNSGWSLSSTMSANSNGDTLVGDYFGSIKFDFRNNGEFVLISDSLNANGELVEFETLPAHYSIDGVVFKVDSCAGINLFEIGLEYEINMDLNYPYQITFTPDDIKMNKAFNIFNFELFEKFLAEEQKSTNEK
ncbi:MAG: hypothetical protein H6600_06730 [Flavobacteriales bacterium]|nr:hypothetical protein [Flavobacteriales bacterium]